MTWSAQVYFRDVYAHQRTADLARDFNAVAGGPTVRVGPAAVLEILSVDGESSLDPSATFEPGQDQGPSLQRVGSPTDLRHLSRVGVPSE